MSESVNVKCVKCGHDDGVDARGLCNHRYSVLGEARPNLCGCKCVFPSAEKETAAPVERELTVSGSCQYNKGHNGPCYWFRPVALDFDTSKWCGKSIPTPTADAAVEPVCPDCEHSDKATVEGNQNAIANHTSTWVNQCTYQDGSGNWHCHCENKFHAAPPAVEPKRCNVEFASIGLSPLIKCSLPKGHKGGHASGMSVEPERAAGEKIRSAAVRKAGVVYPCFAHTHLEITRLNLDAPEDVMKGEDSEQGFVTTLGRFVDRLQGLEIARKAGQIIKEHAPVHGLFSEDLRTQPKVTAAGDVREVAVADDAVTAVLALIDEGESTAWKMACVRAAQVVKALGIAELRQRAERARAGNVLLLHMSGAMETEQYKHINPDALDGVEAVRLELERLRTQLAAAKRERDEMLSFFGATLKEDGTLSINMKKYHAAHVCADYQWLPKEERLIEERCPVCIKQALAAAEARVKELRATLTKIYSDNEASCGCGCNTNTCCNRVGEPCSKCDARAALDAQPTSEKEE